MWSLGFPFTPLTCETGQVEIFGRGDRTRTCEASPTMLQRYHPLESSQYSTASPTKLDSKLPQGAASGMISTCPELCGLRDVARPS